MYTTTIETFNYAMVFGCMLGIYIMIQFESVASQSMKFIRRFKT